MQNNSCQSSEQAPTAPAGKPLHCTGIGRSIAGASFLLAWDVALTGSFVLSYLTCPVWFLVSVVKNAVQRPGWKIAISRTMIPVLTLGLVLGNNAIQLSIGDANADRIIDACKHFHADAGTYPSKLDDLVPGYLASIPRARYCLSDGEFMYFNNSQNAHLTWCVIPPYGRKIYNFERGSWGYLD